MGLYGRKYIVQRETNKTWFEARDDCESLGGFLMTVNTPADLNASSAMATDPNDEYWLGGNDLETEGLFTWHSGERQTIDATMWRVGEPSNSHGKEHCLVLDWLRRINDFECDSYLKYICELIL